MERAGGLRQSLLHTQNFPLVPAITLPKARREYHLLRKSRDGHQRESQTGQRERQKKSMCAR